MSGAAILGVLNVVRSNWQLVLCGLLLVWAGIAQMGWDHCSARRVSDELAARKKADALSDELVIEQAKKMAVTEKTVVEYVDRIRKVPVVQECPADDRDRLGSRGVRDIVRPAK